MVLGHPEIFICSDTNPLFQRIVNLNLRPDDIIPFPTTHLENIHIESRPMAVRIRMENYMREQGYSDEEIQRVTHPRSQTEYGCPYQRFRERYQRQRVRERVTHPRSQTEYSCPYHIFRERVRQMARQRAREREANPEEIILNQFSTIQLDD